ncbi:hypothetical protein [Bacillus cereus group sp. MYBK209-1]|jgi:hypothetical protein|uniref:hypothetical protein n=1 Tax=Bacillus cereus group sp. MYBK209-1 TaxID=3450667 RepID=UPI003F790300
MITISTLFSVFRLPLLILGILFVFLIALVLMKRMAFGKPTYTGSSGSGKSMDVAMFSSITSSSDAGRD